MPSEPSVRILFVGDMHLGRLPSGVPPAVLENDRWRLTDLGPGAAWARIVEAAVANRVHAVALAGDLVERDGLLFETFGPLATGVRRLVDAGILVAAVAGNHDTVVLPRLADEIAGFQLLGPGGTWSTVTVAGEDGHRVRLAGWSFPRRHHDLSPLQTPPPRTEGITFGLLHADLDAPGSSYAPVGRAELNRIGFHGWFLGHVHKPGAIPGDGSPFYLGSVTGLTPSETGRHGPVLAEVSPQGTITAERLPLAPLRWEHRELDCTGLEDPAEQLERHVLRNLQDLHTDLTAELDEVRALGVRLTLTGSVAAPAALDRAVRDLQARQPATTLDDTVVFLQRIVNRAMALIDLAKLAERSDPPGLLARRILALEDPAREVPGVSDPRALADDLVAAAGRTVSRLDREAVFRPLNDPADMDPDRIRAGLARTGRQALARLLEQGDDLEADRATG